MSPPLDSVLGLAPALDTLARVVDRLRPKRRRDDPAARLRETIGALEADPEMVADLRETVGRAFAELRIVYVLVESGILRDRGVGAVLRRSLGEAILPPVFPANDARSALPKVFRRGSDWRWVTAIPTGDWARLFELLLTDADLQQVLHVEVAVAVRALALRIAGAGADQEIDGQLAFLPAYESPFLGLPIAVHQLLRAHLDGADTEAPFEQVQARARACRRVVDRIRDEKTTLGTSLRLTRLTRRMDQQLERLELLLRLVHPRDTSQLGYSLAALLQHLLEAEQNGRRLGRRLSQSVDLYAYQITEQTAAKGSKYIGSTGRAWMAMLIKAMGGGAIVGVFAIAKLFLSKLDLPLAAKAFAYGLNYAACFVCIYLAGATLATKQPAVTASAIAKELDENDNREAGLEGVAQSVILVWRSQFVSFLGNLLCAFPAAWLTAWLIERQWGVETVTVEKAQSLLAENHPFDTPTLFYAAVAGVFLFSAGLVQGAVDNRVVYTHLKERLMVHPRLWFLGPLRQRFAKWVSKNAGGLTSNVVLGFLLGSAGVIGKILGLPIDIRHIAFSSAHVGVAFLDAPQLVTTEEVAILTAGVLGIGFVNFLVSFGLTLVVTLKSRQVTVTQGWRLVWILVKRFVMNPFAWFLPVGSASREASPA